jgi:hypothetical protein
MLFEKPDVLYFLLLLIIPVLVHLFQLRKFKTTKFSNVALLQRIQLQSRKSSKIKKWLILMTRLLSLVFLVLAFAKPFIPSSNIALENDEVVIYLDNSFSMEMPGKQISLLEEAKQNLWEELGEDQKFSLLTNNQTWKQVTKKDIKEEFFSIEYASVALDYETLLLKAQTLFKLKDSRHSLFIISDGLNFENIQDLKSNEQLDLNMIIKEPASLENFSIASAQLETNNSSKKLKAKIQSYNQTKKDITVSLYNDEELIAKTKANFEESRTAMVEFILPNTSFYRGKIELEPDGLSYDNKLFFSLNKDRQIKVISLETEIMENSFLNSIYQTDIFDYKAYTIDNFDYTLISEANLVILNEVKEVNPILLSQIKTFISNGGKLILIPSETTDSGTYRELQNLRIFSNPVNKTTEITSINFKHPLFENVFSEEIKNFDYPKTSIFFEINQSFTPILMFSNSKAFLAENNQIFSFASPLESRVSNFINSPLVVPVFYNIALQSSPSAQLYSTVGEETKIDIRTKLLKDEILKLSNDKLQVIPQQIKRGNTVQINTQYQPDRAGYYQLKQNDSVLMHLSFNYNRSESDFNPLKINNLNSKSFISISEAFNSFTEERKILELWTWMLIFAIGFFLMELLILRFLK